MSAGVGDASTLTLDPGALRRLGRPVSAAQLRLRAMADHGWDINTLYLVAVDVQQLAQRAAEQHIIDLGNRLYRLHEGLKIHLDSGRTPDDAAQESLMGLVSALNDYGTATDDGADSAQPSAARRIRSVQLPEPDIDVSGLPSLSNVPHLVTPPPGFLPDEGPAPAVTASASAVESPVVEALEDEETEDPLDTIDELEAQLLAAEPESEAGNGHDDSQAEEEDLSELFADIGGLTGDEEPEEPRPKEPAPSAATREPSPDAASDPGVSSDDLADLFAEIEEEVAPEEVVKPDLSPTTVPEAAEHAAAGAPSEDRLTLYMLHGGDGSTAALGDVLEEDFDVQSFTDPADFMEILGAIGPDGVIMDDAHLDRIDDVGPIIRKLRAKTHGPLSLIVFSTQRDLQARLRLMRAGADVFIPADVDSRQAAERIREELQAAPEDPYRILIVEDDRSQAIFAQSILRRAGMDAYIEHDPLDVMHAMESLHPDLILMDLHMPGCDGMELTAIIREREAFVHTPIVFLSGEDDEDIQFDALLAGGDDFLSKPIRPRHLISAVKNRVRRARTAPQAVPAAGVETPDTEAPPVPEPAPEPAPPTGGLVERRELHARLGKALETARAAGGGKTGAVLYAEVDRLYALRRRHGITVFDELAEQVEPLLVQALGAADLMARYGDAAWCLFFPEASANSMERVAQDLVKTVGAHPVEIGDETTRITLSAGVCAVGPDFDNAALLVAAAERVCNRDADEDYGRVGVHRQVAAVADSGLRDLGEAILEALDEDRFQMVYQPIVSLQGQEVDQYQCLLRLPREDGEPLAPARVLSAAAELGMVDQIDRWVLQRAIGILSEASGRARPLQLFVNQSGEAAGEGTLADWVVDRLKRERVPGSSLVLEFKLHELARALKDVVSLARELSPRRIRFCLGHFDGSETGFRILDYYRAEFVKIRPEVAFRQLRDKLLPETVQRLHDLGAQVVVPGVEEAQLAVQLWSAGVDFIQGHFVQKPESDLSYNFASSD